MSVTIEGQGAQGRPQQSVCEEERRGSGQETLLEELMPA